jgi:transcriptional regulator with XRE-family HTH domain
VTTGIPELLPELGPLLGRLVAPPAERAPIEASFDQVRLELLSTLFDRAREARDLLAGGDEPAAHSALGGGVWLGLWEQAVSAVTRAVSGEIELRIREAATLSRYPRKRLAAALPDAEALRLLAARLSATGIELEAALERLGELSRPWQEELRRAAGELEASWERLLATAREELLTWDQLAATIRVWRRPWQPLLLVSAVLLGLASWLGLVLGGYLSAPGWLRPSTDWAWKL